MGRDDAVSKNGIETGPFAEGDVEVADEMTVVNEFAVAHVRKVKTRNGERLEVRSPRFGYAIRLDALTLEALTWQTPEVASQFLSEPVGPEE